MFITHGVLHIKQNQVIHYLMAPITIGMIFILPRDTRTIFRYVQAMAVPPALIHIYAFMGMVMDAAILHFLLQMMICVVMYLQFITLRQLRMVGLHCMSQGIAVIMVLTHWRTEIKMPALPPALQQAFQPLLPAKPQPIYPGRQAPRQAQQQ